RYFGGDHWSSFARSNPPDHVADPVPLALPGSHGDLNRSHYYGKRDLSDGGAREALSRYLRNCARYRQILDAQVRDRGSQLVKEHILETLVDGFEGYYALDFAFLDFRVRRQFPPVAPSVVLPMLTTEMVMAAFWRSPSDKVSAAVAREMTARLVPAWNDVPYFHEVAEGGDPALTNKVSRQKTYWEEGEEDFYGSLEAALIATDFAGFSVDDARREISSIPEGRNRTNQTFEFVFWHHAAQQVLLDAEEVKR